MSVAFYFDHNMQTAVVASLRANGFDVLTALEDEYDRHPDEDVLDRAMFLKRVVVTHDQDFLEIAADRQIRSEEFPGIIFSHSGKSSIGTMVADLTLISEAATYEELLNQVTWIPL